MYVNIQHKIINVLGNDALFQKSIISVKNPLREVLLVTLSYVVESMA